MLRTGKCKVELTKGAYKQFKKLPLVIQQLASESILAIEEEGATPKFWDHKKIGNGEYRIRLNYRYRMKYRIKNNKLIIEIFYIGHRKDAYR